MGEYQELLGTVALALGVAWASGLNLYATIAVLGLGGATGYVDLPSSLEVIQDPQVILAASFMYCVEFMADKVPGFDTAWDTVHTIIRIPGGALLAASAAGPVDPAIAAAAGVLGGTITAVTHAAKSAGRILINTSAHPFGNWAASVAEDIAVFAGLWAALWHPVIFLLLLVVFLGALCWVLPKLLHGVRAVLNRLGSWLGLIRNDETELSLQHLQVKGILTEAEYQAARARLTSRRCRTGPVDEITPVAPEINSVPSRSRADLDRRVSVLPGQAHHRHVRRPPMVGAGNRLR